MYINCVIAKDLYYAIVFKYTLCITALNVYQYNVVRVTEFAVT